MNSLRIVFSMEIFSYANVTHFIFMDYPIHYNNHNWSLSIQPILRSTIANLGIADDIHRRRIRVVI